MKYGMRKPNIKKSVKARTTGKMKRQVKKAINPLYGKKGMGIINNPKKSAYNALYNRTTIGVNDMLNENDFTSESTDKLSIGDIFGIIGSFFQLLFALLQVAFWLTFVVAIIAFLIWIF